MNTFHQEVWAMETAGCQGDPLWSAWIDKAEALAGHDLDGDEAEDGYSVDGAFDAFNADRTPEQYVAAIVGKYAIVWAGPESTSYDPERFTTIEAAKRHGEALKKQHIVTIMQVVAISEDRPRGATVEFF